MPATKTLHPNLAAFLDMIAASEGTTTDPTTQNDGYDVLVTGINGPARFDNYATHPNILVVVNHLGLESTAAGRYQLLHRYFQPYATLLNLPDFSPLSQDAIAVQQITERHAIPLIEAGDLSAAIAAVSNLWASLPGPANTYDQHENAYTVLQAAYIAAGGVCNPG